MKLDRVHGFWNLSYSFYSMHVLNVLMVNEDHQDHLDKVMVSIYSSLVFWLHIMVRLKVHDCQDYQDMDYNFFLQVEDSFNSNELVIYSLHPIILVLLLNFVLSYYLFRHSLRIKSFIFLNF